MQTSKLIILLTSLLLASSANAQSTDLRTYFIGNSLSNDLVGVGGFEQLASSNFDGTVLASQHIQCSTPLTGIIASSIDEPDVIHTCANPASLAGADFNLGRYPAALSNPIDVLIIQPFQEATFQEEIASAKTIIDQFRSNPDNADSQIFIYQTWDLRRSTDDFLEDWNNRLPVLDEEFRPSRATYELFFSTLRSDGYDFEVIPAGDAFVTVAEALQNGAIGNVTDATDLFRDFIHGSNAGRYLASLVAAQVITGESALDVPDADQFEAYLRSNHRLVPDAEAAEALRRIASNTANGFILGDCNRDGSVDSLDISTFVSFLTTGGFIEEADFDYNGSVNFVDISPFVRALSQ